MIIATAMRLSNAPARIGSQGLKVRKEE